MADKSSPKQKTHGTEAIALVLLGLTADWLVDKYY